VEKKKKTGEEKKGVKGQTSGELGKGQKNFNGQNQKGLNSGRGTLWSHLQET